MLPRSAVSVAPLLCCYRLPIPCVWFCQSTAADRVANSENVEPPFKKYRDPTSVLRALSSCVRHVPEAGDFRLGPDPWLGNEHRSKRFLLAQAKGRLSARLAMREYVPNDIVGLAKEVPRVDQWLPLQLPSDILKNQADGHLSASDAMDRLLLLMAPNAAWSLYNKAASEEWSEVILHRLLDLLCVTNGGAGGVGYFPGFDVTDLGELPEPNELFFADLSPNSASSSPSEAALKPKALDDSSKVKAVAGGPEKDEVLQSINEVEGEAQVESIKLSGELPQWTSNNAAEQLFEAKKEVFSSSPAAYCSMIRGAARFSAPERAWELAEKAWSAGTANVPLDLPCYNALLRCLGGLASVQHADGDVWPYLKSTLDHLMEAGLTPNVTTFESTLYSLATASAQQRKIFTRSASLQATVVDYSAVALGLLEELGHFSLQPTLGVMSNVISVIQNTRVPSPHKQDGTGFLSYQCSTLLHHFLNELTSRWEVRPPSRLDAWSLEDFTFFPKAMYTAWLEYSPTLASKIHICLTGHEDRRFLLPNHFLRHQYTKYHCLTMLDKDLADEKDPVAAVARFQNIYRMYRHTIVAANWLTARFTESAATYLLPPQNVAPSIETSAEQCSHKASHMAYTSLAQLLNDMFDASAGNFELRPETEAVIALLSSHATIDHKLAFTVSALALRKAEQAEEAKATTTKPMTRVRQPVRTETIQHFVRMCLTSLQSSIEAEVTEHDLNGIMKTLHGWLHYAMEQDRLSWSWTPTALVTLWQFNSSTLSDILCKCLEKLVKSSERSQTKDVSGNVVALLTVIDEALTLSPGQRYKLQQLRQQVDEVAKSSSSSPGLLTSKETSSSSEGDSTSDSEDCSDSDTD